MPRRSGATRSKGGGSEGGPSSPVQTRSRRRKQQIEKEEEDKNDIFIMVSDEESDAITSVATNKRKRKTLRNDKGKDKESNPLNKAATTKGKRRGLKKRRKVAASSDDEEEEEDGEDEDYKEEQTIKKKGSHEEEESFFEVQQILEARTNKQGQVEYLVRWVGYASDDDTWEPEDNIFAPKKVAEFKALQKQELASRLRKRKRSSDTEKDDQEASEREEDGDEHHDLCEKCGSDGRLLCCDVCPRVYHLGCLNPPLSTAPRGRWACPNCVQICQLCMANELSLEALAHCYNCDGYFHHACLSDPCPDGLEKEEWLCSECSAHECNKVEQILTFREVSSTKGKKKKQNTSESNVAEPCREFYVKWKDCSHARNSWVTERWLERVCPRKYTNFIKKNPEPKEIADIIPKDWTKCSRIVAERDEEYLVKYEGMTYDGCTWEPKTSPLFDTKEAKEKIKLFKERTSSARMKRKTSTASRQFKELRATPSILSKACKLHPYQLEGLNWLLYTWSQHNNAILADEMGLGKTVQAISFVAQVHSYGYFPFLVVAPLSTLGQWDREFTKWAPHLNVIVYSGTQAARDIIRQYELYFSPDDVEDESKNKCTKKARTTRGRKKPDQYPKFDVMLISYEMLIQDNFLFTRFQWEAMVVDEGQRLKNHKSALFQALVNYKTNHRVLLSGTPLQNNLTELFCLMNFLQLESFQSLKEFEENFGEAQLKEQETVTKLHSLLRPHILRRLKEDVLGNQLPPKAVVIVPVSMSPLQKEFYKAILTKNYLMLHSTDRSKRTSLLNIVMQLRKCCNHPYLIPSAEPTCGSKEEEFKRLVAASGKLRLVDQLLTRLKEQQHRVLIFSQMTHMLDILEDYLQLKGWKYERLDGAVKTSERQASMDRFNDPSSKSFCFLLSTRAGKLGLNLATADTVIIYDSDWNPQNDIQALSRAHRIGQLKSVIVYQLVTRGSVEEKLLQRAKMKLALEHLVVTKMDKELSNLELNDILRFGAAHLFQDNESGASSTTPQPTSDDYLIDYDAAAIEKLLDRSQARHEDKKIEEEADDKLMDSASFSYARVWDVSSNGSATDPQTPGTAGADDFWQKLLSEKYEIMKKEQEGELDNLGKGKRVRKVIQYYADSDDEPGGQQEMVSHDDDDEFLLDEEEAKRDMKDVEEEEECFQPQAACGMNGLSAEGWCPCGDPSCPNNVAMAGVDQGAADKARGRVTKSTRRAVGPRTKRRRKSEYPPNGEEQAVPAFPASLIDLSESDDDVHVMGARDLNGPNESFSSTGVDYPYYPLSNPFSVPQNQWHTNPPMPTSSYPSYPPAIPSSYPSNGHYPPVPLFPAVQIGWPNRPLGNGQYSDEGSDEEDEGSDEEDEESSSDGADYDRSGDAPPHQLPSLIDSDSES